MLVVEVCSSSRQITLVGIFELHQACLHRRLQPFTSRRRCIPVTPGPKTKDFGPTLTSEGFDSSSLRSSSRPHLAHKLLHALCEDRFPNMFLSDPMHEDARAVADTRCEERSPRADSSLCDHLANTASHNKGAAIATASGTSQCR